MGCQPLAVSYLGVDVGNALALLRIETTVNAKVPKVLFANQSCVVGSALVSLRSLFLNLLEVLFLGKATGSRHFLLLVDHYDSVLVGTESRDVLHV